MILPHSSFCNSCTVVLSLLFICLLLLESLMGALTEAQPILPGAEQGKGWLLQHDKAVIFFCLVGVFLKQNPGFAASLITHIPALLGRRTFACLVAACSMPHPGAWYSNLLIDISLSSSDLVS